MNLLLPVVCVCALLASNNNNNNRSEPLKVSDCRLDRVTCATIGAERLIVVVVVKISATILIIATTAAPPPPTSSAPIRLNYLSTQLDLTLIIMHNNRK